ncbi:hypothetical protein AMS68_004201 [Peltaster fructicola]|uniref:Uncharacterized protein n=1 Tax=Peltaster fructicola TaxID=286661 RepID=A0A6H0XVC3_9PEZI|nr:hypothetical protein AMS68_004201 [Peltaster fructicola]
MARPGPPGAGPPRQPPISFKTVPGRNRTQKWNQAKTYNYDGDDWGGYDPYDEYGGDINDASAAQTGPYPSAAAAYPQQPLQRQQSFESGSERRQFSAPLPDDRSRSPAKSTGSSGYSDRGGQRRREYSNPAQVPPPLNTRTSPVRPNDDSLNKDAMISEHGNTDATSPSGKSDKPLPFIRPSDIYKRMAEEKEKERQSSDSSRPSMESIHREGTPGSVAGSSQRPLSTVQERPGSGDISTLIQHDPPHMHPGYGASQPISTARPLLPPVAAISDFGMDILGGSSSTTQHVDAPQPASSQQRAVNTAYSEPAQHTAPLASRSQQSTTGLQNVVQTAFDRQDSTASSVYSRQPHDVSRSNTNSTSSISPIMSRVPSTATAFQRQQDWDTSVPPIAEEPAGSHSRSASGETVVPPSHHNFSSLAAASIEPATSADNPYRRSLNPTGGSPAHTPALETVEPKQLSNPMSAQITTAEPEPEARATGRPRAGTDYSLREADLAQEASSATSPVQTHELAQTQTALQNDFLNEHSSTSTSQRAAFDATPDTSALPTQSPLATGTSGTSTAAALAVPPQPKTSQSSTTPAASLTAPSHPQRLNSFQPHMPGEWISPAPTPATEMSQPALPQLAAAAPPTASPLAQEVKTHERNTDDEEIPDFTPNASRKPQEDNLSGALTAVKDAGSALGAALLSGVGLGHQTRDFASEEPSEPVEQPVSHPRNQSGAITSRMPLYRELSEAPTESNASIASDIPPTPPAKDDGMHAGTFAGSEAYSKSTRTNQQSSAPEARPPLSTNVSTSEYESDRLRKDIERSLNEHVSPVPDVTVAAPPKTELMTSQSTQLGTGSQVPSQAATKTAPDPSLLSATARPVLLDQRFSWESQHETAGRPTVPMAVVGELPGDKDRQSYERPSDGQGLHVVNAPPQELVSPLGADEVSPLTPTQTIAVPISQKLDIPAGESIKRTELSPSPVSMDDSSHIPSYYAGVTGGALDALSNSPDLKSPDEVGQEPEEQVTVPLQAAVPVQKPDSSRQSGRIPPFREILAIKEAPERIKTYADTRQSFAEMNTGLNNWMSGMLAKHAEHSDLVTPTGAFNAQSVQIDSNSMGRGHRHNPSLLKIKQFAGGLDPSKSYTEAAPDTPPKDYDGNRQQMEKMQAKGKDLMKSAGAFGGKAQAGAMGLLAKGRSRFGRGEKDN